MSCGVIRIYCFLSLVEAVSIYPKINKHRPGIAQTGRTIIFILIRRFTASMNTSNSSVLTLKLIAIKQKKKKHTKTPDRTPNRLPQRKQQTNCRERLFTPTQRPRVLVPSLRPSLIVRLYLFVPHLTPFATRDSPHTHLQLQRHLIMIK